MSNDKKTNTEKVRECRDRKRERGLVRVDVLIWCKPEHKGAIRAKVQEAAELAAQLAGG